MSSEIEGGLHADSKPVEVKKETISVSQFKYWFAGLADAYADEGDDWVPTAKLWRRIRDRIAMIEEQTPGKAFTTETTPAHRGELVLPPGAGAGQWGAASQPLYTPNRPPPPAVNMGNIDGGGVPLSMGEGTVVQQPQPGAGGLTTGAPALAQAAGGPGNGYQSSYI